ASPQHPESIAAYATWAAAAVKHFHGRHIIWEIWNEPNGFFWKPKPDAEQYSALAVAAGKAIREADPRATLIGPALSGFQPPYMETFLKSGVLRYLDAVSVHPYRSAKKWPETAEGDYQKLREKIEQYGQTEKQKKMPIISGEWGYSTKIGDVSPETQAAYIVRQQLFNLLNGVPLSIWYDWKNDGTDPREVEHNFGTVTDELEPKPAYEAIKVMTHELEGYRIKKRLETDKNDFVLLCSKPFAKDKIVAWTTGYVHNTTTLITKGKGTQIELGQMPKYLTLK
ncbi:MAG TPA: cellulase family glycosylhydrolase, partial [Verrucomicrobiae bacterium]|nr:cellulase family glycosylhydrolase [Verrucomicrobiae bacterium]